MTIIKTDSAAELSTLITITVFSRVYFVHTVLCLVRSHPISAERGRSDILIVKKEPFPGRLVFHGDESWKSSFIVSKKLIFSFFTTPVSLSDTCCVGENVPEAQKCVFCHMSLGNVPSPSLFTLNEQCLVFVWAEFGQFIVQPKKEIYLEVSRRYCTRLEASFSVREGERKGIFNPVRWTFFLEWFIDECNCLKSLFVSLSLSLSLSLSCLQAHLLA